MLQPTSDYQVREQVAASTVSSWGAEWRHYSIDLREIAQILNRRRLVVIFVVAALLAMAGVYLLLATPLYTATTTVLIDPHRSSVVDSNNDQAAAPSSTADDAVMASQVGLIQSIAVLQRVVDQLGLAHDPEFGQHSSFIGSIKRLFVWPRPLPQGQTEEGVAKAAALDFLLRHRLKVSRDTTSFLINISVSSDTPEKASKIANAIADSYFQEQVRGRYDTQKIAASWFNKQIAELKSQVLAADKAVAVFRAAHNLTIAQGSTINDQQLANFNNQLIEAHVQTAEARAKFQLVQNIVRSKADPGTLGQALTSDVIARLRTQYADVAKNLADMSSKFGPQHPLVVNARAQVAVTQKLIDQEEQRILESTRQALQVAQSREDALQKSLDGLKQVSNDAGSDQVRLRELQREAEANHTLYASFLARYKETTAQESVDLPDARLVSKADIPIEPSSPKTALILAFALACGVGCGGVMALAADRFDRRVKSQRQVEDLTGFPMLGAIPIIGTRELARRASRGRRQLGKYDPNATGLLLPALQPPLMRYVLEEPTSLFAESIRAVRLALQRASRDAAVKTIMVSSSVDSEGKTTLAVNLAQSLTAVGMRTILVEGDQRNPEMSRSLCPRANAGSVEVTGNDAALDHTLFVDSETGLTILPAPPNEKMRANSEFVFSEAMNNILEQLKRHFDYIVVDAPPLIPLVDARALAELVDRVVLAVRWDSTPHEVVERALSTIAFAHDRILGTVLTRVDMQRLRFYDHYQSSSYLSPYSYVGQSRAEVAS
jgi:polysaccharide biosynthesis transport protein